MKKKLEMLLEELNYLKREGINSVYCEDVSLEMLKAAVKKAVGDGRVISTEESILEIPVSEVIEKSTSSTKKLNPFSPLPQDVEIIRTQAIEKASNKLEIKTNQRVKEPVILEPALHIDLPKGSKDTQWNWLKDKALKCPVLSKGVKAGSKMVFGNGNLDAKIFFCGDAPGIEEEAGGMPFGGEAGQLLNKIIKAMGLGKEDVYIANIMNFLLEAPTHFSERTPTQGEMNASLPYLKGQIEIVQPKVIVALGATAVNGLLGIDKSRKMSEVRGKWFEFENRPLMITFHPSYLIRNNTLRTKRHVWEDMLAVMTRMSIAISDKQREFFANPSAKL